MYAVGNGELANRPSIEAGDRIRCRTCQGIHELEAVASLMFYRCDHQYFLAGVENRPVREMDMLDPPVRDAVDEANAELGETWD